MSAREDLECVLVMPQDAELLAAFEKEIRRETAQWIRELAKTSSATPDYSDGYVDACNDIAYKLDPDSHGCRGCNES